jgi:hypothetical protein
MNDKKIVYVAGPYTLGDVAQNVALMIDTCDEIADMGFVPICPLLTHFWHMMHPREYEFWMEYDSYFVGLCHILYRMEGESSGADRECNQATAEGKPVVKTYDELLRYKD